MKNLERHPFWMVCGIVLLVVFISEFGTNSTEIYAIAGLFLGAAGFANSLWLNQRINKTEDVLYKKNIATLGDFSLRNKDIVLEE